MTRVHSIDQLKSRARASFFEAFNEVFNSVVAEDEDSEQASPTDLVRRAWEDADPCLCQSVAETIERAVELTIDRTLIWAHIIESEDAERFYPDGWYAFIAVDPTGQCLTLHDDYCGKTILARVRIRDSQEAIEAISKLSCLILRNLGELKD